MSLISAIASPQKEIAAADLSNFDVPLSLNLVDKGQDWKTRQKVAYAGMKKNITDEFHSLKDYQKQLGTYSHSNPTQLLGPLGAIAGEMLLNQAANAAMSTVPGLGLVGPLLADGDFGQVFSAASMQNLGAQLGISK